MVFGLLVKAAHPFDPVAGQVRIGINPCDDIAASGVKPSVASKNDALPGLVNKRYKWITLSNFGRLVGGIIIDDNDFAGRDRLVSDGLQAGTQMARLIVCGYDDTYANVVHGRVYCMTTPRELMKYPWVWYVRYWHGGWWHKTVVAVIVAVLVLAGGM